MIQMSEARQFRTLTGNFCYCYQGYGLESKHLDREGPYKKCVIDRKGNINIF